MHDGSYMSHDQYLFPFQLSKFPEKNHQAKPTKTENSGFNLIETGEEKNLMKPEKILP